MNLEAVIGLEVHVQLKTASKIFSGSSTAYGAAPNTQASAVDIALPGVLPVMNRRALDMAICFGLAVGASVNCRSQFARKNYFYPDSPKGYQISQFDEPIVSGGQLEIDTGDGQKTIGITRAHLEEDAGKSLHEDFHGMTGIDLNRAGTPLLEIVSEPDMRTPGQAGAYLRKLHTLVRYLGICDGNMQEGSFRCDANVSIRPAGSDVLNTRTEIKNVNSFRFIEKAIAHEIRRQSELLEDGGEVIQETRLYDPDRDETRPMRGKEEAHDYRYFPDPDLPAMVIDPSWIDAVRDSLPELPDARRRRYTQSLGLSDTDARLLSQDPGLAEFFEQAVEYANGDAASAANWINGELVSQLNKNDVDITQSPVSAQQLGELVSRVKDNTLSSKIAKSLLQGLCEQPEQASIDDLIKQKGLRQISDSGEIGALVDKVLKDHPAQVQQYRDGNHKVLGFFVGQVMKATRGKANPRQVNELLREKL